MRSLMALDRSTGNPVSTLSFLAQASIRSMIWFAIRSVIRARGSLSLCDIPQLLSCRAVYLQSSLDGFQLEAQALGSLPHDDQPRASLASSAVQGYEFVRYRCRADALPSVAHPRLRSLFSNGQV